MAIGFSYPNLAPALPENFGSGVMLSFNTPMPVVNF